MDNQSLQVFNNGQFSVRSVCDNGEIWFVARDIATALEYKESSVDSINKLMAIVPEIWKGRKRFLTVNRGEQEMLCLTEQVVKSMLDNYEEIAFKAVIYPVAVALYSLADELSVFQVKKDCEDNCMFILDWIDKLDSVARTAHESIEGYTARLGYHVENIPELETPENF